jgi:hypothetical protein
MISRWRSAPMIVATIAFTSACGGKTSPPPAAPATPVAEAAPTPPPATPTPAADAPPPASEPPAADHEEQAYDFSGEALGALTFKLDGKGVEKVLGKATTKTKVVEQAADGTFVTTWSWPKQGVEVGLSATARKGPFTVSSLSIAAPSTLKTAKGVGLGATADQIQQAYGAKDTHVQDDVVLVGSAYGGLFFTMKDGKVASIFIGVGAE